MRTPESARRTNSWSKFCRICPINLGGGVALLGRKKLVMTHTVKFNVVLVQIASKRRHVEL